jgi:hypothetical protein
LNNARLSLGRGNRSEPGGERKIGKVHIWLAWIVPQQSDGFATHAVRQAQAPVRELLKEDACLQDCSRSFCGYGHRCLKTAAREEEKPLCVSTTLKGRSFHIILHAAMKWQWVCTSQHFMPRL